MKTATLAFAPAIFLSAFLLFQVQPLMGKYILPWFGGSPEVWTACMLVFQALLLGGYAYAHLSVSRLTSRAQAALHALLLVAALATLPINPSEAWKPAPTDAPTLRIMLLLAASVGLPFFTLAATGPLLQAWVARLSGGRPPYRLYALSNAGSLLALASYPLLVEPNFTRHAQGWMWSVGLGLFAALCGWCMVSLWRGAAGTIGLAAPHSADDTAAAPRPAAGMWALWLALPAVASVQLLAVTNKITLDIAAVPFLWVLPLAIYLLTFVISFHHERWYYRPVALPLFGLSLAAAAAADIHHETLHAGWLIAVFCLVLFATCLVCHGELYRLRPHPRYLTGYYLMIAAGGALGGLLVAVVAPLIFDSYAEFYLGLLACCACMVVVSGAKFLGRRKWVYFAIIVLISVFTPFMANRPSEENRRNVLTTRNFFGVLTVWEGNINNPAAHYRMLVHGNTYHGLQFLAPARRSAATAYYSPPSGVGLALRLYEPDRPRRIGVVGLGVGTVATYCETGDVLRGYEINPEVVRIANEMFYYLPECPAEVEIVLGDARLSMEAEDPQQYDVLILDAFASDTVPVHLLTVEAFGVYLRHLAPGGVIAAHVSSRHLQLEPVLWRLAAELGLETCWIVDEGDMAWGTFESSWVLLARERDFFDLPEVRAATTDPAPHRRAVRLWTDERVNLFEVLR